MAARQRTRSSEQSTPDVTGDVTTPQHFINADYSFTLQAVMELQKSTGQLTESINSLRSSVEKQTTKLEKLEDKLSAVTHKIYAAGVVLTILLAVGGFLVNKAWNLMAQQITFKNEYISKPAPTKKPPEETSSHS